MVIDSQGIPVLVAGPSAGVGKRGVRATGKVVVWFREWRLEVASAVILRRSYGALTLRQDSVAVAGRRCG